MTTITPPDRAVALTEQSRLLTAAHTAMRADALRLSEAVGRLGDVEAQPAAALGGAFAELVKLIHDHHRGEDDVIYPFLLERLPRFETDAMKLEQDHVELDAVMTRIAARLRLLAHQASKSIRHDTHARLIDDATHFGDLLREHLQREEETVVPAIDTAISAADRRLMDRKQTKLATYAHLRRSVPWVLANVTPEQAVELRAITPRLVGLLHDHAWKQRFGDVMAPLYAPDGDGRSHTAAAPAASGWRR